MIKNNSATSQRVVSDNNDEIQANITDETDWEKKVEVLILNHKRLKKINNLENLSNLRRASFVDNEISNIEGLQYCKLLEELSLESNRIGKISGISHLC